MADAIAITRAALALVSYLVLPGIALAARSTLGPAPVDFERVACRAVVFGMAVFFLSSQLVARTLGLSSVVMWVTALVIATLSCASLAVTISRKQSRFASAEGSGRSLLVAVIVSAVGASHLVRLVLSRTDVLLSPTPWYYWLQVQQTIAAGTLPTTMVEWGITAPFLGDYPSFDSAAATVAVMSGRPHSLLTAHVFTLMAMMMTGLAMFLLARAWRASLLGASAAVLVLFASFTFATKLASFRPESAGYALMLLAPALALSWFENGQGWDAVAVGVALLALGQVHPIALTVAMVFVGATALASVRLGRANRRLWFRSAGWLVLACVAGLIVTTAIPHNGARGASTGERFSPALEHVDPTWEFVLAISAQAPTPPPTVASMASATARQGFYGLSWNWHAGWLVALFVCAVLLLSRSRGRDRVWILRFFAFALLAVAAVVSAMLIVRATSDTYVPLRVAPTRLLSLLFVLLAVGTGVVTSTGSRRVRMVIGSAALVLASFVFIHAGGPIRDLNHAAPSAERLAFIRSLPIEPGSTVLANCYTEGFLPVYAHVQGLLDGRAPYGEKPILDRANNLLRTSAAFFKDPIHADAEALLADVRYVLVATDVSWTLATPRVFPTDLAALEQRPDLREVASGPGLVVFEVVSGRS